MSLAFITTGDTRQMPPPTTGETRSEVYGRYAALLVGARNVIRATGAADALNQLRGKESSQNIYLIGHGNALGYSFAVSVQDDAVASTREQMLTSPLGRSGSGLVMDVSATSYHLIEKMAQIMHRAGGPSRLQVRACYQSREVLMHIARTILHVVSASHVLVTGYTDYYALVERSNGTVRSEIQVYRPGDGSWSTISSAPGTQAPAPQVFFCVRGGQLAVGGCP